MRGRTLTEDDLTATRARLVALALDEIEAGGREALSLRQLAARAGLSRSTPYTYFADKDALIEAARVAALHRLADGCEAALAAGADVPARLRGVGQAYLDFALGHPHLYDLIFEPCAPDPARDAASARYRAAAEAPLVEAEALGLLRLPAARVGHVLWAATHGLIGLHRAGKLRQGLHFETVLEDLREVLAFGFAARGKA